MLVKYYANISDASISDATALNIYIYHYHISRLSTNAAKKIVCFVKLNEDCNSSWFFCETIIILDKKGGRNVIKIYEFYMF